MFVWAVTIFPFSYNVSLIPEFHRIFYGCVFHLTMFEVGIIKYLTEFHWKRIPPIDHDYFVLFLKLTNILLAIFGGVVEVASGNLTELNRLRGENVLQKPVPIFILE